MKPTEFFGYERAARPPECRNSRSVFEMASVAVSSPDTASTSAFPPFDSLGICTQTVIAKSNVQFDLELLFDSLPCLEKGRFVPLPAAKAGAPLPHDPNTWIPPGTVISLNYQQNKRGNILNTKTKSQTEEEKTAENSRNSFKNSIIINMYMGEGRVSNFKVSQWGKFQLTGCKSTNHFLHPIICFLRLLHNMPNRNQVVVRTIHEPELPNFQGYQVWFVVVMRNLYCLLPKQPELKSLYEFVLAHNDKFVPTYDSKRSQSVRIKRRVSQAPDPRVPYIRLPDAMLSANRAFPLENFVLRDDLTTNLLAIQSKDESTRLFKKMDVTFIVYETSKVFVSGRGIEMPEVYSDFCRTMDKYYEKFGHMLSESDEKSATKSSRRSRKSGAKSVPTASSATTDQTAQAASELLLRMQALRLKSRPIENKSL